MNNSTGNPHFLLIINNYCERLNLKSHAEMLKNRQGIIFNSSKYKIHIQPNVSCRMAQILICRPSLFLLIHYTASSSFTIIVHIYIY